MISVNHGPLSTYTLLSYCITNLTIAAYRGKTCIIVCDRKVEDFVTVSRVGLNLRGFGGVPEAKGAGGGAVDKVNL